MINKLIFVIPAYNEEGSIGTILKDVKKEFPQAEIVVVNDGSTDKTEEIAKKEGGTQVHSHEKNRGLGASLATGIKEALRLKADHIVTFDADLQHASEDVEKLLKPLEEGASDAVIGSRFLSREDRQMMPFSKKVGNFFLTNVTNWISGTKITDSQSGLRAFNRKAAGVLSIECDRYEVSSEIIYELGKNHMRISEIPIKAIYHDITKGTSILSGIKIFIGILTKIWPKGVK